MNKLGRIQVWIIVEITFWNETTLTNRRTELCHYHHRYWETIWQNLPSNYILKKNSGNCSNIIISGEILTTPPETVKEIRMPSIMSSIQHFREIKAREKNARKREHTKKRLKERKKPLYSQIEQSYFQAMEKQSIGNILELNLARLLCSIQLNLNTFFWE